ncbi:unnamed protein product [Anisakis simplex]|uniref:Kazal-like domain-containing protein n=1 Tax=Anisakis simplex TaxID=6269 RepID=A0A0M3KDN9_ANISI|nr:unnamed protein product [Anisakis simplex]
MLKMIFACHFVALLLITCFLIQCPARDFVGINLSYQVEKVKGANGGLYSTCNADCSCKSDWNPVCHEASGYTFYSACYAGCTEQTVNSSGTFWDDCKCLDEMASLGRNPLLSSSDNLRQGFCEKKCGYGEWIFLFLLFLSVVASFASGIPSQQIMLRVVPFQQRTLGIGVHWTFLRLLAVVCKLVSILAAILGYMTYRPNDLDNGLSVQTADSRGPLSLTVNDDRPVINSKVLESIDGAES